MTLSELRPVPYFVMDDGVGALDQMMERTPQASINGSEKNLN